MLTILLKEKDMYQFISSIVEPINGDKNWSTIDISNVPLDVLYALYARVIVILSNPFLSENVAVDLSYITPNIEGSPLTFNQFLIQNANKTLPALSNIPSLNLKYVEYIDGFKFSLKITPTNPNTSVTANQPQSDKQWLFLTKDKLDYDLFYNTHLVNVNGFFHLIDTDNTGIYVIDAMKTARRSNLNQIGVLDFSNIGNIQTIPITPSMVYKQIPTQKFKDHVYINTCVDNTNKTVALVLGGYLHILDDDTFHAINSTTYKVNFNNLPFLDRYFESKYYLDLSSLKLSTTTRNKDQISVAELYSDESILAYLTLSQSFFVLIDNDNVSVIKTPLRKTSFPNMFITYEEPKYPLIIDSGKILNYWSTYEDSEYSITLEGAISNNYIYDTVGSYTENSVDNARFTIKPISLPNAYFLKISTINI